MEFDNWYSDISQEHVSQWNSENKAALWFRIWWVKEDKIIWILEVL